MLLSFLFVNAWTSIVLGQPDSIHTITHPTLLIIKIESPDHQPIDSALVRIKHHVQDSVFTKIFTDKNGFAVFGAVHAGDYTITVTNTKFPNYLRIIHIDNEVEIPIVQLEGWIVTKTSKGGCYGPSIRSDPPLPTRIFNSSGQVDLQYYRIW